MRQNRRIEVWSATVAAIVAGWLVLVFAGAAAGQQPRTDSARVRAPGALRGEVRDTSRAPEDAIPLSELVVTPGHYGLAYEQLSRPQTLTREQLETRPQLGEDAYRMMERLPGVSSSEMSAQFSVRGGRNDELLVRLDGVDLYEPFHLKDVGSGLSIVDVHTVGGVDLTTGGFTAEYGDRLTGVLDLRTASRLPDRRRTELGISLSNARFMSTGSFAKDKGLWLVSARRGYLDFLIALLNLQEHLNPRYYDVLAKIVYQIGSANTISAHVLRAGDDMRFENNRTVLDGSYGSTYAWLNWNTRLGGRASAETVASAGSLGWLRNAVSKPNQSPFVINDDRTFHFAGVRQDWSFELSSNALLKWGFEAQHVGARYDYFNRVSHDSVSATGVTLLVDSVKLPLDPHGLRSAAYIAPRVRIARRLTAEVGLRYDRQSYTNQGEVSPRVNLALSMGRATLRAAWGQYFQSQQIYQLQVQDGDQQFFPAELAEQRVFGVEAGLGAGLSARIEAYDRRFSRLHKRYLNLNNTLSPIPEAEFDRVLVVPTAGDARGIELLLKRDGARSDWSISYALARAQDQIGARKLPRPFDQRHTLYLDAGFRPSPTWRLSAAWQLHSGWPATASQFRVVQVGPRPYTIETFDPFGAARLPTFHRLDFRATRSFQTRTGRVYAFVDVFNAYNRRNARAFDYSVDTVGGNLHVERGIEPLLPRLPSVGVSWEF
jgi:hypothetical protein